ncbi:MAG: VWA domain-containing protein [Caldilineae bacterium]|nr:VWA domain-containing protein [Caldilineae bacterium]
MPRFVNAMSGRRGSALAFAAVLCLLALGRSVPERGVKAQQGGCSIVADQHLDRDAILHGEDVGVTVSVSPDCGGEILSRHYVIAAQPWTPAQASELSALRASLDAWIGSLDFGGSRIGLVLGNDDPAAPTATPRPAPLPTAEPRPRALAVALTQNRFLLQTGLQKFVPAEPGVPLAALVSEARNQYLDAEAGDRDFYGRRHILIVGHAGAPLGRRSTLDFELALASATGIDVRWYCIGGGCPQLPGLTVVDLPDVAALSSALQALHDQPAPLEVERLTVTSGFSDRADFVFDSAVPPADQMGRLQTSYIAWRPQQPARDFEASYRLRPLDSGAGVPVAGDIELEGITNAGREIQRVIARRLSVDVGEQTARPSSCRLAAESEALPSSLALGDPVEVGLRLAVDCSAQGRPLDVVLAIDRSASMLRGGRLTAAKIAARRFVEGVDLSVARVALLAVGTEAETLVDLSTDRAALLTAIDGLQAAGENDFGKAFDQVRQVLRQRRPDALPALVLLSDGDTVFPTGLLSDPWLQAAFWAHLEGIRSIVVCVTDAATCKPEFQQLASPASHFRVTPGGEDLAAFYTELARYLGRAEIQRLSVSHRSSGAFAFAGVPFGQDLPTERDGRLVWQRADPLFGRSELRYQLRAAALGSWPVAERIEASWIDRDGAVGQASLPVPVVEVRPPASSGPCPVSGSVLAEPGALALGERVTERIAAEVAACQADGEPLEVVLVLDHSDSMSGPRIAAMRRAVEAMLARPGGDVRFGLVAFSGQILAEQPLDVDRAALLARLLSTAPAGETNIGQALNRAGALLDDARPGARSVVILVTDGRNSVDPDTILTAADSFKDRAELIAACIGAACDPVLATAVTRQAYYFDLPGDEDVVSLFERMAETVAGALPAEISIADQSGPAMPPVPGSAMPALTFGPDPNIWRFGFPAVGKVSATQQLTATLAGRQPVALWTRVEYRMLSGAEGMAWLPSAAVEIAGEAPPVLPTSLPLPTVTPGGPAATPTRTLPPATATPGGRPEAGVYLPWLSRP